VSEVAFLSLDHTVKPVRAAWVLSKNAGVYASIDVDVNENGGGIVYTQAEGPTGQQLWFQLIDDTGLATPLTFSAGTTPALRIVNSPFRGIDVSVAKLRVTFAIAYRALPAVNMDKPQIRLMFLNRQGDFLGDSDLSYTSDTGGRTAIKTAYDGRTVVSWTEINDAGQSVIRVVRLPCTG
jgi:hypothetical protein